MSKLLSASHQGRADNEIQASNEIPSSTSTSPYPVLENSSRYSGCSVPISEVLPLCDTPPRLLLIALLGFCGKKDVERLQYAGSAFISHQKIQHQCGKCPIRTQGLMHLSPPGMNLHSFCFYLLSHGALRTLSQAAKFHEMLLASSQGIYGVSEHHISRSSHQF